MGSIDENPRQARGGSAAGEQSGAGRSDGQHERQQEKATPGVRLVRIVGADAQRGESGIRELHATTLVQAGRRAHPRSVEVHRTRSILHAQAWCDVNAREPARLLRPLGPVVATEDGQVEGASRRRKVVAPRRIASQLGEQALAIGFLRLGAGGIDDARGLRRRVLGGVCRQDGHQRQAHQEQGEGALEVHADLSVRRLGTCSSL